MQPAPSGRCLVDGLPSPLVGPDDPTWGRATAPVTLVIFDEFDHLFTRRLERTLVQLREHYGPDQLRIVWKHYPLDFHRQARPAALVGQAVYRQRGADAFWRYRTELIARGEAHSSLEPDDIVRAAGVAGLDAASVESALHDEDLERKVRSDIDLTRALDISGAPHSFVNGHEIGGTHPFDFFAAVIDKELAAAADAPAGSPELSCQLTRHALAVRAATPPEKKKETTEKKPEDTAIWKIPVGSSAARGPATALVTIIEFGGYQDPYSQRVEATLQQLRHEYGDKLRIVWKDNPLSFQVVSAPAAEVTREIRDRRGLDAFWSAHDQLLDNHGLDEARLFQVAASFGLDEATTRQVIKASKHQKAIGFDQVQADEFKASSTPHFFVNGRRLVGAQPVERFREIIDEQMKRAEAELARGTAPAALYDTLVAHGKLPEPPERITVFPPAPGAPVRGDAHARVVIQQFANYQDPFTARVDPTLQELLATYKGKVQLIWRELPLPFHTDAPLAAEAAAEAQAQRGLDTYWKMHDLLLAHQKDEGGLKQPALEGYAQQLGLDLARFRQALADHRHAPRREADMSAAAKADIKATPTFVINGYKVSGAQPLWAFRRVIDMALRDLGERPPPNPFASP